MVFFGGYGGVERGEKEGEIEMELWRFSKVEERSEIKGF